MLQGYFLYRFSVFRQKHIADTNHRGKSLSCNSRIKAAKRLAYEYRYEDNFFSLIQFISIHSVRAQYHKKT